jgi:hypothetical protein
MLDDAWCIALAGTDHDRFLRAPNNAAAIQAAMRDLAVAINKSTETERADAVVHAAPSRFAS